MHRLALAAVLSALWPGQVLRHLLAENLALRQQLAVLRRSVPRPRIYPRDRIFWVALSRAWSAWRSALAIVQPATVISWHRSGFRLFWRLRSGGGGRPTKDPEVRALVRRLALDNPTWGAPRIHGELRKLGFVVEQSTVSRYMPKRPRGPPSPTWRTFLRNHLPCSVGIDFFVIPTASFQLLYGFVVLDHFRRKLVAVEVTCQPTSEWTANTLRGAFPFDTAPRFLLRDRDGIYGDLVRQRLRAMAIEEVISAPRSPWQKGYASHCTSSVGFVGGLRRLRERSDRPLYLLRTGAPGPGGS